MTRMVDRHYARHPVDAAERILWAMARVVAAAQKHYDYPGEGVFRVALGERLKELRTLERAAASVAERGHWNGASQRLTERDA